MGEERRRDANHAPVERRRRGRGEGEGGGGGEVRGEEGEERHPSGSETMMIVIRFMMGTPPYIDSFLLSLWLSHRIPILLQYSSSTVFLPYLSDVSE